MKTAISIPDPVFSRAQRFANRQNMSRSALFTAAVSEYLDQHREENVTAALNRIYANEDALIDPVLAGAQGRSLAKERW